jgi:RNA polymerase sigma-70 factor (ECF subfamily)
MPRVRSAAGFGDSGEFSRAAWTPRRPAALTSTGDTSADAVLTAARGGDEDAFRALYRDVQPKLLRYLQVLVGADAEDVASDAWLQIARDLGSFRGDVDGFRGWATTIARNRAMDHLRRQQRRPVVHGTVEDVAEPAGSEDTAQTAVDSVATDAALALIAGLPRDQAEAVLLRVVVGLDAKAAAKVLGKRPGAVRTAAHRGLRTLAAHLDASPPPGRTPPE